MESPVGTTNEYQKKRIAMSKRVASLGKDNPVVAKAVKNLQPPQEDTKWKNWQIVDELVNGARKEYFDEQGESLKDCLTYLSQALSKLASKKGIDNGNSKGDTNDNNEDY